MKTLGMAALALGAMGLAPAVAAQDYRFDWSPAGSVIPTPPAPDFVMLAASSDLYEIQSSQAVLETTSDSAVRAFAEMMVTHHTRTSQDLMAAATAAGVVPPPPMLARHQAEMIGALRLYQGVERDRLYLTQQMLAHSEALGLMRTYAETGDRPQLKTAAAATVPVVQRHLTEVERLIRR